MFLSELHLLYPAFYQKKQYLKTVVYLRHKLLRAHSIHIAIKPVALESNQPQEYLGLNI